MREELMGHLLAAHGDAVKLGVDAAVGYAVGRLGDVEELRDELQGSVPRWETYEGGLLVRGLFENVQGVFDGGGGSALKVAFMAGFYLVSIGVLTLVPLGMLGFVGANLVLKGIVAWGAFFHLLGILILIMLLGGATLSLSLFVLRVSGLCRFFDVRGSLPSVVTGSFAALLCVGGIGLFLTLLLAILEGWSVESVPAMVWEIMVILVWEPVFYLFFGVYACAISILIWRERGHFEEWGRLDIGE